MIIIFKVDADQFTFFFVAILTLAIQRMIRTILYASEIVRRICRQHWTRGKVVIYSWIEGAIRMPHAHAVHIGKPSYMTIRRARTLFTTVSASRRVQAIKCGFLGSCSSREIELRLIRKMQDESCDICAMKIILSSVRENYCSNEIQ